MGVAPEAKVLSARQQADIGLEPSRRRSRGVAASFLGRNTAVRRVVILKGRRREPWVVVVLAMMSFAQPLKFPPRETANTLPRNNREASVVELAATSLQPHGD